MKQYLLLLFLLLSHSILFAQTDSTSVKPKVSADSLLKIIPSWKLKYDSTSIRPQTSPSTDSLRTAPRLSVFKSDYKSPPVLKEKLVLTQKRHELFPVDFVFYKTLIIPFWQIVVPDSILPAISKTQQYDIQKQNKENIERNEWIYSYIKKYKLDAEYVLPSDTLSYDIEEYRYILVPKMVEWRRNGHYEHGRQIYCMYDRVTQKYYGMPEKLKDTKYFKEMAAFRDELGRKINTGRYSLQEVSDPEGKFQARVIKDEEKRLVREKIKWNFITAGVIAGSLVLWVFSKAI